MAAPLFILLCVCGCFQFVSPAPYVDEYMIDDSNGLGRTFDGIGGISGGGVWHADLVLLNCKNQDDVNSVHSEWRICTAASVTKWHFGARD